MIGSIVPRPIAFVSTIDQNGLANLAPFSFFTAICPEPMTICFAPMRRGTDGAIKDTLSNIMQTSEFVINIVGENLAILMNDCSIEFKPEVDEFDVVGLTKLSSHIVKPPRVAECSVSLECVLDQILEFGHGSGGGSLVIGRVVLIHVDDHLYQNGKIDNEKLRPIGRMAGSVYTRASRDTFVLERKKYPDEMKG
jgi:flavin reductase (DIM6/NTAB) family NADH-FMN oxidoreductase RutF